MEFHGRRHVSGDCVPTTSRSCARTTFWQCAPGRRAPSCTTRVTATPSSSPGPGSTRWSPCSTSTRSSSCGEEAQPSSSSISAGSAHAPRSRRRCCTIGHASMFSGRGAITLRHRTRHQMDARFGSLIHLGGPHHEVRGLRYRGPRRIPGAAQQAHRRHRQGLPRALLVTIFSET